MSAPRVIFMGTGDIALPSMQALLDSDLETVALVTQPDKKVGRKQIVTPPKIKVMAEQASIPVMQPEKARDGEFLAQLEALQPDIIIVMAYGQILTQALLDIPSKAIINLHASLLPKHRGASCIQTAIDQGDQLTGMTVMHVVKELDAGDIIVLHSTAIGEKETAGQLHDRLADIAPTAMMEALEKLIDGTASRQSQDDALSNYAPKLLRDHGLLDWSQPAENIERRIRAYDPWPGTYTTFSDAKGPKRLKIFPQTELVELAGNDALTPGSIISAGDDGITVACGSGALKITTLQPDGSKRMSAADFARSGKITTGDQLA